MRGFLHRGATGMRFAPLRASGRLRRPIRRVIVVIAGPNPSFDYYLAPRLTGAGSPPLYVCDVSSVPPEITADVFEGAFVLFCRYMTGRWLSAVEQNAQRIAGVGYFIDDDLDALFADPAVPLTYRLRLVYLALMHRRRFSRLLDLVFASNSRFSARHGLGGVRLLSPAAGPLDEPNPTTRGRRPGPVRLAFHSTRVHAREHRWLSRVMAQAMPALHDLELEVFASAGLRDLWEKLPRTTVRRPLFWPAYRAWTRDHGADLLLAPLLPNDGNLGRSPTKRIEAMRLGAALLVSDRGIYAPDTRELELGMFAPPENDAWIEAIRTISRDPGNLLKLRDANRRTVAVRHAHPNALFGPDEIER